MIFDTYWFLFGVVLFLPLYWLAGTPKIRLWLLLCFCFLFHMHFAGAAGVVPIVVLASLTYFAGRSANRLFCAAAIVACTLALCHYKYSLFFADEAFAFLTPEAKDTFHSLVRSTLPLTPPLAISFFTFEFVHYLLEIRKQKPPIKKPADFAAFTFFFPTLVAGPVKRYDQFIPALKQGLTAISSTQVMLGLLQVATGYGKKLVLADNLTPYIESRDLIFSTISLEERWLLLVVLNLRIYFDFSGYSDIAIGLARMMGIEVPANFNWPYLSTSIREFWRRWHISLSTWIRDYIYIPIAGGKHSKLRKVFAAFLAMSLCGLWHGAAWHFVAWGIYHGVGLCICALYRKIPVVGMLGLVFDRFPISAWLVTMFFVFVSRLLFFYPLGDAVEKFCLLFTTRIT